MVSMKEQIDIQLERIARSDDFMNMVIGMQFQDERTGIIERIELNELDDQDILLLVNYLSNKKDFYDHHLSIEYSEAVKDIYGD